MVGPDDVAAGVKTRWDATGGPAAVPGGLWYGRVREDATAPYARLTVTAQELGRLSNLKYHRTFIVRIEIWGDAGPVGIGAARTVAETVMYSGLTVPNATKVIDTRAEPTELTVEESPRAAADVCLMALEWRVVVQGS